MRKTFYNYFFKGVMIILCLIMLYVSLQNLYNSVIALKSKTMYNDKFVITSISYLSESNKNEQSGRNYMITGIKLSNKTEKDVTFKKLNAYQENRSVPNKGDTLEIWSDYLNPDLPIIPNVNGIFPVYFFKKVIYIYSVILILSMIGLLFVLLKYKFS